MPNQNTSCEKKICYVSSNHLKYEECSAFLKKKSPGINTEHIDINIREIQTRDHRAIAVDKAEEAWRRLKKPLFVDDMGIYLEKYGTFPGTLTKFVFQGIGYKGLFRLVDSGDRAVFIHNLVYIDKDGLEVFETRQEGAIIKPSQLENDQELPFDQVFVPDGYDRSYEELRLSAAEKYEKASYRIAAFEKFLSSSKLFKQA
jgi:non-canonical purine NTP pyrophosphatase (RdgB/HAM1 family)